MKKLTIEHILQWIKDNGHNVQLISTLYESSEHPMQWKCQCSTVFTCTFSAIKHRKTPTCPICWHRDRSASMMKKYGYVSPFSNKATYDKGRATCKRKFGVKYAIQSAAIKRKQIETNNIKYGRDNVFQVKDIQDKVIKTNNEKYGVPYPGQNKDIKLKMTSTMIEKYGCKHPSENLMLHKRMLSKINNRVLRLHWATNEELICQGSWEAKVVDYLNTNKINYLWHPQIFILSTGKRYIPDFYLVDDDKWIEIKGYMRGYGKEKWDEFHSIIKPNSELWNELVLKEKGII